MQNEEVIKRIGKYIAFERKRQRYTKAQLCRDCDVHRNTLLSMEKGISLNSFNSVYKVFSILNLDFGVLNGERFRKRVLGSN